jgi:preprotein translocase subunit SecF
MKKWNIDFIKNTKRYFIISGLFIALLLVGIATMGVALDIQFKGGALITYSYEGEIYRAEFRQAIEEVLGDRCPSRNCRHCDRAKELCCFFGAAHGISAERQLKLSETLDARYTQNNLQTTSINVVNPTIARNFLLKALWPLWLRRF